MGKNKSLVSFANTNIDLQSILSIPITGGKAGRPALHRPGNAGRVGPPRMRVGLWACGLARFFFFET